MSRTRGLRGSVLIGLLGCAALLFVVTFSWQQRQWAQVARLDSDVRVQQERIAALRRAQAVQGDTTEKAPDDVAARLNAVAQQIQRRGGGADNETTRAAAAQLRTLEGEAARSPQVAEAVAGLYQEIGYWDRAYAVVRAAGERAPEEPALLLRRGYIELALGRPALAQTRFREAARRAPDMPETHLALALSADQAGDRKGAERELRVAHRLRPTDWRILILLAQNLNGQRRYDQALGVLEEAGRIAPAEPAVYATKAAVLYDQAHGQENRGTAAARFEPALTAARRWLALDPNSRDAHNLLANIFLESGDEAEAQRLWERIYAVDPAYPKLRLNLGRLLVRRGDRTRGLRLLADERRIRDEAAEFNRLVILAGAQNENPAAHRQLARWCQKQGRLSRAILEWREVLARLPADAEAQAGLRRCLTLRGDPL